MKKIKTLLFIMLIVIISCGQNTKDKNRIDYKQELKELAVNKEDVKGNSIFFVEYRSTKCRIEIYVNDKLLVKSYKYFRDSQGNKYINQFLLKSKNQKVKINIYPTKGDVFDKHSSFRIELSFLTKELLLSERFDEQDYFIEYSTDVLKKNTDGSPFLDDDNSFVRKVNIEGLSYFEKEFEFDAEIPFENEALQNSKDLRKLNTHALEQKVLAQYQAFANSVKNKNEQMYWEMYYNKGAYFVKANLFTKEDIEDFIKEGELYYNKMTYPAIENYELVFYDEGRLVCFESKSSDLEFRGKSPLIATAINPKDSSDVFRNPIQFYFHMHKDSTALKPMY
ncbi:MAG: hypothetical protein JKY08_05125 [Flavobacteriaceae bacterium]|nr:hypothetical protein [Flavobacteriaceae bacterium]